MIIRRCLRNMARSSIPFSLHFDNKALELLPVDPEQSNHVRQVKGACFSLTNPQSIENPVLVTYSSSALNLLGLTDSILSNIDKLTSFLCGNQLFDGSRPAAHCYCGHQFGSFAGQLGDGAAMYLGEVINEKRERWEIQIKGAGKTPYSRFADGRKVLRSSLREFLCSEAMFFLNIPTTRAGSIVTSDSLIERDLFYDGHPIMEKCSVVLRIAQTFIRFGSFEICKPLDISTGRQGPSFGNGTILKTLLNYVIESFYPEIWLKWSSKNMATCYTEFFREIVRRTAALVAKWQCVGFCHGVLNSDNMSIVGITIDYGPFGFMDRYDPNYTSNSSDTGGRYSYQSQPSVCKWNCLKLAEALKDLMSLEEMKEIIESVFDETYKYAYLNEMFRKIGLEYSSHCEYLIDDLLDTMFQTGSDYTNTFLTLEKLVSEFCLSNRFNVELLLSQTASLEELSKAFKPSLNKNDREFFWKMAGHNKDVLISMGGRFILDDDQKEGYLDQMKDWTETDKKQNDINLWRNWLNKYETVLRQYWSIFANHQLAYQDSIEKMKSVNPRIVLRNYLAQIAIKAAEAGDFSVAEKLLDRLKTPFLDGNILNNIDLDNSEKTITMCQKPPNWACDLKVT